MLNQEKVVKLELCTLKGNLLMTVSDNYSFPKRLVDESHDPRNVMMIKGKNLPVFAKGAFINIVAYMKSNDRVNYPAVIDISTETQLNVTVRFDRAKLLEERRRYFKIDANEPCGLFIITRGEKQVELEVPIPCIIKNINLGGVFLHLQRRVDLNINDSMTILVPDMMGERVEFVLKILRIQKGTENELLGYGCCFLFLSTKQEELLAKYINKLQIAKRAMERTMQI